MMRGLMHWLWVQRFLYRIHHERCGFCGTPSPDSCACDGCFERKTRQKR